MRSISWSVGESIMAKRRASSGAVLRQIAAARARDTAERSAGRRAMSAYYDAVRRRVMIELTNGAVFGFPVRDVDALAKASADAVARVEVSPGGGALHWEELD